MPSGNKIYTLHVGEVAEVKLLIGKLVGLVYLVCLVICKRVCVVYGARSIVLTVETIPKANGAPRVLDIIQAIEYSSALSLTGKHVALFKNNNCVLTALNYVNPDTMCQEEKHIVMK